MLDVVTESVVGETLRDRLRRGPLQLTEVLGWFGPFCEALTAADERGIAHRRLCPEKLVRQSGPGRNAVKVLDFGLCHLAGFEEQVPRPMVALPLPGAPHDDAPEVLGGGPEDGCADRFVVGARLYEALSGRPAFCVADPPEGTLERVRPIPPLPVDRVGAAGPALDVLITRLCARDPRDRPERARGGLRALLTAPRPVL